VVSRHQDAVVAMAERMQYAGSVTDWAAARFNNFPAAKLDGE